MKKIFEVSGMHCPSCAMTIEWDLEEAGIKAKCDYAREKLEVEFDPQVLPEEKIRMIVEEHGYKLV